MRDNVKIHPPGECHVSHPHAAEAPFQPSSFLPWQSPATRCHSRLPSRALSRTRALHRSRLRTRSESSTVKPVVWVVFVKLSRVRDCRCDLLMAKCPEREKALGAWQARMAWQVGFHEVVDGNLRRSIGKIKSVTSDWRFYSFDIVSRLRYHLLNNCKNPFPSSVYRSFHVSLYQGVFWH